MNKKLQISLLILAVLFCMPMSAQIKIKGVLHNNRYDDGDQMPNINMGWNSNLGKQISIVERGIWAMELNGDELGDPYKEPAINVEEFYEGGKYYEVKDETTGTRRGYTGGRFIDDDKALWVSDFNMMYGNSGALYVDGKIVTVMSRDESSTTDDEIFAVRKWDATTGALLTRSDLYLDLSKNIESAGMSYNPIDGKIYGIFHVTDYKLSEEQMESYVADQDDTDFGRDGVDDGWVIGTIDLKTMKMTPITPGLYYDNFVAFAINSEGRAFGITSGGASGYTGDDGKLYNANGELTGAQVIEFDLKTGLAVRNSKEVVDETTSETYIEYSYPYPPTGYSSQTKRQAACFAKSNPNKLYWIGYYNSGKGYNEWGSWSSLSDREWRTNHKYDTALYEFDLFTGNCQRVALVPNRCSFSCIWIDGDDNSDGAGIEIIGQHDNDSTLTITYNIEEETVLKTKAEKGELTLYLQPKEGWKVSQLLVNNEDNLANYANGRLTIDIQTHTVINVFFEWADTENLYTEDITGIVNIEGEDVKVQAKDGQIMVDGAAGKTVRLYTIGGSLITTAIPSEGMTGKFTVPQGTYIIQIGQKAAKITLR